ncbi:MAG: hypothetical protein JWO02_188 [Solirubrobacterales bacterium]|nr:hypothetical protein [Solirubrobacterales bacterium]
MADTDGTHVIQDGHRRADARTAPSTYTPEC